MIMNQGQHDMNLPKKRSPRFIAPRGVSRSPGNREGTQAEKEEWMRARQAWLRSQARRRKPEAPRVPTRTDGRLNGIETAIAREWGRLRQSPNEAPQVFQALDKEVAGYFAREGACPQEDPQPKLCTSGEPTTMPMTIDATCPECGEEFEFEDFNPEDEINETDCPECGIELEVLEYDPETNTLTLAVIPDGDGDETDNDADSPDEE